VTGAYAALAIPAYNAATTIGETLDALQANPGLSRLAAVVLLDDCSADRTAEVARAHWRSPVPLEVWCNQQNMGQWRTTNELITRLAERGEWTFILHADDVVKPHWLSLYLDELPRIPRSVATVCSSYDRWWSSSGRIETGDEHPGSPAIHITGDRESVRDTLESGCWWHLSGCAIRNAAFREIGGFEPDLYYLADWEWLLRCLVKGYGAWYLRRTTMFYRQHERSVTSRSFREGIDIKEKQQVFAAMRSRGYICEVEHKGKVRGLLRQLARRAVVRLARGDWLGFRSHSRLLHDTMVRYMLGRL
jgi:GT2 family glycosyltransferase